MKHAYLHLFSPIQVGDMMLKNRIISSPAGIPRAITPSSTHYGSISAYDRGLGGAGLVIDPIYGCGLEADQFSKYGADSTREILSVMRQSGGMAAFSLRTYCTVEDDAGNRLTLYPSVDGAEHFPFKSKVATTEDLKNAIDNVAWNARRVKEFGFDAIMLMMADSTLPSLMLSKWNKRTDAYGGTLENRCRWAVECAKAVRDTVGPSYPIVARICRTLGPIPESYSEEDSIYLCQQLKPYVNGFIIYNGLDTYGKTIEHYEMNVHGQTTVFEPKDYNLNYCGRLKKATGLPVFINCGITGSPSVPDKWIAEGKIDGVSMARQLFADPFWPKKAEQNRADDIVPCLRCNNCYHISTVHQNVQCSVNPRFRRENRVPLEITKTHNPKKVVVVGGGPAGMRAALWASEKGHNVTLVEKSDRLGGLINYADYGKYKAELREFRDYLLCQIEKSNVKVLLNTPATKDLLESMQPDGLIIATGSRPATPPIKGIEHATQLLNVYDTMHDMTGRIAIIGGGAVGSEAALELAENGKDVTLIECGDAIASKENWLYRIAQRQHMAKCPTLKTMLETKVIEIKDNMICALDKNGNEVVIEADHILYSVGMIPNKEDAFALYDVTPNTTMIGDCRRPGHVLDCTNDAYFVATNI